jgi:hypothetical protein
MLHLQPVRKTRDEDSKAQIGYAVCRGWDPGS